MSNTSKTNPYCVIEKIFQCAIIKSGVATYLSVTATEFLADRGIYARENRRQEKDLPEMRAHVQAHQYMTQREIDSILEEYEEVMPDPQSDSSALAEIAVFIEDVFGIQLDDSDICEARIGTLDRIRSLIYSKSEIR